MMRWLLACCWVGATVSAVGCSGKGGSSEKQSQGDPSYCDVEGIIERYCLRCHGDPVQNYAPFSLNTWESIQVLGSTSTGELMWESMARSIQREFMPLLQLELEPPVEPLLGDDRQLLLDWLALGAPLGDVCE